MVDRRFLSYHEVRDITIYRLRSITIATVVIGIIITGSTDQIDITERHRKARITIRIICMSIICMYVYTYIR